MAVSVDSFGKALVASGLMSADDVKSLWNALPADGRPKDGTAFARLLVEQGKLNEFQSRQIFAGKGNLLVFGEYVVLKEIGAGGMGQVYQAQHQRMKRLVALKVMSQAAMKDEAAVRRFQREVEAAARLEHPNIVTAFDAGRSGEVNYLVMQFVDGGDLSVMVKQNGPLPIQRAVDYVVQAANGLAFAHGEGVIHRDIKPANLLCDKKGVVKILDMGLARIENGEEGLTATEQVMGTVDYMSPEQASNTKSADARSDIYSLGCTLWYLLTGRKTYDGESMIMRLMAHRDAPLPSLVKARDNVPWPLEQAFHRMIAKRPDERFQTMDEVAAALAPFGGGGGGGTTPTGTGSSIGMGSGPHDKELSAFMKSVGPSLKAASKPSPSGITAAPVDATAQLNKSEVETDPKSEVSLAPLDKFAKSIGVAMPARPQPKPAAPQKPPPHKALIAAAAGGAALLILLGLWFIFRDRDGNETARVQMPDGGSVQVQQAGPGATPIAIRPAATPVNFFGLPEGATSTTPAAPPPGDYALYCTHVTTPVMIDLSVAFTLEAYITPSVKTELLQTSLYATNLFTVRGGKTWSMSVWTSQGVKTASSNVAVVPGKRTHVAAICKPNEMGLYVDGVQASRQTFDSGRPLKTPGKLEIGADFSDLIDEVRVSKMERYSKNFTPPTRFAPDPETLALYHCDEGSGITLADASAFANHGTIDNPKWVRADGSASSNPGGTQTPPMQSTASPPSFRPPSVTAGATTDVLLLGDGYMQRFPKSELAAALPGRTVVNRSESGTPITELTRMLTDGKFRDVQPRLVVLQIGYNDRNNLAENDYPLLVAALKSEFPESKFLFTSVLSDHASSARFNAAIQTLADDRTVFYFDLDPIVRDGIKGTNLTLEGYQAWAAAMKPLVERLLNESTATPVAATPNGSPAASARRWPLSPSKPEDIQRLHAAGLELTLRNGGFSDAKVAPDVAIPTGPWTVVGVVTPIKAALDDLLLGVITGLVDLEELSFSYRYSITTPALMKLAGLTQLRTLRLVDFAAPEAAGILASMPHLEEIQLPYGKSDEWAAAVVSRPSITTVDAYRKQLTKVGLAHLEKMPQLKFVRVVDCHSLKQEDIDRFAAAVPGCRIEWGTGDKRLFVEPRTANSTSQRSVEDFVPLFNGKDLTGWSMLAGGPGPWKVVNRELTCEGSLTYLFTDRNDYEDFHLRAEVRCNSGGNGGIYFRCRRGLGTNGHPVGFEAQILNGPAGEPQKTGSLYNIARIADPLVAPDAWFDLDVIAAGPRIRILINGKQTVDYTDPTRELRRGPIALQHYNAATQLAFRKLEIKELAASDRMPP